MIAADAAGKVNLSLRVGSVRRDGFHDLQGLFQSIDWFDHLSVTTSTEDAITGPDGSQVIDDADNLAWRAAVAVRERAAVAPPLHVELDKHLPVGAGLGGGSADAAAALAATARLLGVDQAEAGSLAPALGSDVPFCFVGGLATVTGRGERVDPLEPRDGFVLGLVVPPVEVDTARVYRMWDELGAPEGPEIDHRDVPPGLRSLGPFINDLTPAALAVEPMIGEWRAELAGRWQRPVVLTGSGPTLFSYFVDADEADAALAAVPIGARAATTAGPLTVGWRLSAQ